jgi:hypothetical protein
MIWVGRYLLAFDSPPSVPERGWAVGKGPLENMPIDLLLLTKFSAKQHDINLRNPHARFNFAANNRSFFAVGCSRSPSAQLTVNGEAVTLQPH